MSEFSNPSQTCPRYIGRYAPTPSGYLHMGHASTFQVARDRARSRDGGTILLRVEDIDRSRCRRHYEVAALEDMRWLGLDWDPTPGTERGWVRQSERFSRYREVLTQLIELGVVYPSEVSRKEWQGHPEARRGRKGEWIFPQALRGNGNSLLYRFDLNWRFRCDYGSVFQFRDQRSGECAFEAGEDFGDFLVWRRDGSPAYELAVVVDDIGFGITEVVRGEDLLLSTCRQLLLYRCLEAPIPAFYHCPLIKDVNGIRLAKRYDSESIRSYRERGFSPEAFWRTVEENHREA